MEEIPRAREIFLETKTARFDSDPTMDVSDRLGLLTVVVGLREVAAFGFTERTNEGQLRNLKDRLGNYGLLCQITRQIRPLSHKLCGDLPSELVDVFDKVDEESDAQSTERLLWVYRHREMREQVRKAVNNELASGTLLSYPDCCVEQDRATKIRSIREFSLAIIDAVGKDAKSVERALREDLKVPLAAEILHDPGLAESRERFPFVQHEYSDEADQHSD